jgi:hypothetical protein
MMMLSTSRAEAAPEVVEGSMVHGGHDPHLR